MELNVARLYNSDNQTLGRLSTAERERILDTISESQHAPKYIDNGDTIYPRVQGGEIAVYLQAFDTDFYAAGDARGPESGDLLDPWCIVRRGK